MRISPCLLLLGVAVATPLQAQDLATTCKASSSYDVTVGAQSLVFDRADPLPHRVELRDGSLVADGATVRLGADDQDRIALFERQLRALVPRVKAVAANGVDMAAKAVREEAASVSPQAAAGGELDNALRSRVTELKQRIAASNSTHDWQGDAFDRYANQIASDILPIVANEIGQQAVQLAMDGDLAGAAALKDRMSSLSTGAQGRIMQRMQALRPQIQALCPSIRQLAELQDGIRAPDGRPLNLVHVDN
jgi:Protein of unknown function (DUF2884)